MQKTSIVFSCALALTVPVVGCKYVEKLLGKTKSPTETSSCVADMQTAKETKVSVEGDLPTRVSAALVGTVHLRDLTERLDQTVVDACTAVARDLGENVKPKPDLPPGERAKDVCSRTAKLIKKKRDADGVVFLLYTYEPMCTVGLDDFKSCVRECDGALSPDAAGVQCDEETAGGRCPAKCDGVCFEAFTEECDGVCRGMCRGACKEDFYGKCGGRCIGTCDGNTVSGKCEGTCDGKCTSDSDGSCQGPCVGKCSGSCVSESKRAKCAGICVGSCSEAFSAERCDFALGPAEMVPACGAMCEAQTVSKSTCTGAYADIVVYNSSNEGAADKIKSALEKRLELLLTADAGMKAGTDRAHARLAETFAAIDETLAEHARAKKEVGACLENASRVRQQAAEGLDGIRSAVSDVVVAIKG